MINLKENTKGFVIIDLADNLSIRRTAKENTISKTYTDI